ncbi:Bromodomain adjacent to zinc finger domain protein 2B [Dissostichus eleginoides]|uniref:Bromodomain adjacent to zinc finger domain protein 2B n=1 Tax=Dissostichus eleginoides TaxID=100907 RepID=A0AAD9F9N6_DISEL|nr:Bromodomain adjacent to zinc finger domain protein 2B [Dissostichus eleginoides]
MESGERLASPAPTLSAARTSSPAASSSSSSSSSPAPHSKSSLAPSPSPLGSTLTTSGRMFGVGEQPFLGSTLSSAFPLVNHPAFGALYSAGAGRPEFGGLGSLGMSAALAAHPQLGALSDQDAHKNSHAPPKGVNGAVNGSGVCPPTTQSGSFSASPAPVQASSKPTKNSNPSNSHRSSPQSKPAELVEKPIHKTKEKKPRKKPTDTGVASNSESGSSSDSSSDGSLSSDLEDLSELSDTEKRTKKKTKVLIPSTGKTERLLSREPHPPNLVSLPCSASPPALSQTSPLALHRSRTEGPQQHFSVIQSTGLAASSKPLALLSHPRSRKSSLKPPRRSASGSAKSSKQRKQLETSLTHINEFRLKQTLMSQGQTFPAERKKPQQGPNKSPKRTSLSSSPLPLAPPPQNNHSNLFLSSALLGLPEPHHPNGVIQSITQDSPLALITKPRKESASQGKSPQCDSDPGSMPVNLSTGASRTHGGAQAGPPTQASTTSPHATVSGRFVPWRRARDRYPRSEYPWSGNSRNGDPWDILSESDSNSDSDISGKKVKELKFPSGSSKKEMSARRLTKGTELLNTSTNHTATSCSPLNLQVIKSPSIVTSSSALAYHSSPGSSSYSLASPLGLGKRKRVMDEKELMIPLELGWRRETRIKSATGRPHGEVAYYTPCGKKIRQYPDVMKGLQWSRLNEEEVIPHILAMEGRRSRPSTERQPRGEGGKGSRRRKGRPPNVGDPLVPEGPSPSEVKLLRKLEAQEIARQAAQMKMMRKMEKQAMARAAKEARKQQAIMAAEERRKQKEQIKILKQQEKIKRIQQIRMEKEIRAQHILEAKRRKKEEVATAKIMEAEKRIKEKELRRQQSEILKHQERERRRQHVMLMKAVEARKKAEERERLRQEKRDEKRLNKERKLEQRRLELEIARELKKPNEDMCLSDHKPLPEFSRIPGLILPGRAVSDCLMLMQFLRGFGKVLGLDLNSDVPTLGMLQEGLLNVGDSMGQVQDLLVKLLSLAVCDPGLPPGQRTKTMLGDHLTNVGINRDNVSEVLQMYMGAHCPNTELAPLALSLKTKAFQAHKPSQKASILGFLGNELACSRAVISEIEKNLDQMANMRKDKIIMEGKLKKLRTIYAKRTGRREASMGVEENQSIGTPSSATKRKRKLKVKKVETYDEDEVEQATSLDELEKQIEKLAKQHHQTRRKLFEISHSLRSMMYGQDRYRRRYWQPGCVTKLCTFRDVNKDVGEEAVTAEEKESPHVGQNGSPVATSTVTPSSPTHNTSEQTVATPPSMVTTNDTTNIPPPASTSLSAPRESPETTPPTSSPAPPPYISFQPNDQLLRVLTERSGHWFSLLPRNPCDLTSVTTPPPGAPRVSPQASSTPAGPSSPPKSPALPLTPSAASASPHHPAGLLNYPLSALQVKSGASLLGVSFGSWPCGMITPSLPLCSSPIPMLGHSLEGNTTASVSSKSESPLPCVEKTSSMPSPALEMPKSLDHATPRPIPEELLTGWWRVSDIYQLRALVAALHSRGMREKGLLRQMQKYTEIVPQVCTKHRDVAMIELHELEESQVSVESVRGWCVEEQAMEMDIAVLQQVEELERKVTSASLQVKGWTFPEPQSEREDLVYYEHKPLTKSTAASAHAGDKDSKDHPEERGEKGRVMRHLDNPLDIAVTRLADLERNVERRYLRSPLGTTIQIRLDNVGTVTVPAPAPSTSADREGGEEEVAHGMKVWRKALTEVRSAAQLAMCIQQLQKSIAWERSIMKVASGPVPKNKKTPSKAVTSSGGGGKKGGEGKKNGKQAGSGEATEEDPASASNTPKKAAKDTSRKRKPEESSPAPPAANQESPVFVKRAKTARDNNRDLGLCRVLLAELERHQDAWPFLTPVNQKSVPGYRKVIKKPMDFSTIREKLVNSQYQNLETFIIDVNLVYDNCEKFNEDNSEIGRAGHNMRKFFEKRWTELLKQTN